MHTMKTHNMVDSCQLFNLLHISNYIIYSHYYQYCELLILFTQILMNVRLYQTSVKMVSVSTQSVVFSAVACLDIDTNLSYIYVKACIDLLLIITNIYTIYSVISTDFEFVRLLPNAQLHYCVLSAFSLSRFDCIQMQIHWMLRFIGLTDVFLYSSLDIVEYHQRTNAPGR